MSPAIKERLATQVISVIQRSVVFGGTDVGPESRLGEDLGLDSFDLTEFVLLLEEEFDVAFAADAIARFSRVDDIIDYLSSSYISNARRSIH